MTTLIAALLFYCLAISHAAYNGPLAGGVPASAYPAGISPQACPNYPNCNNPAVAANPTAPYNAAPAYNPVPGYNPVPAYNPAPAYNAAPVQNALDRGEYTGDGDYHGEGLAESGAFGPTGFNGAPAPSYNQAPYAPAPQYNSAPPQPAQVPAGVDPNSCPNYPYCS